MSVGSGRGRFFMGETPTGERAATGDHWAVFYRLCGEGWPDQPER